MSTPLQDKAGLVFGTRRLAWQRWCVLVLLLTFLICHALAIAAAGEESWLVSLLFLILAPLLASAACLYRAWRGAFADGWIALAIAMLLWAGGMAGNLVSAVWINDWTGVGGASLLLFILYGVPIIFALATPDREPWPVRLIDGAMALALGYLFFRHTFTFATLAETNDAHLFPLRLMFDIENLFILLFAAIRFLASTDTDRQIFFRSLTVFAGFYLATAAIINHLYFELYYGELPDLLIGLPFVLLAGLAFENRMPGRSAWKIMPAFPEIVRTGAPLMLPASLLAVSAFLVQIYPIPAIVGCAIAVFGYGLRTVLVQLRSLDTQNRLAHLSLIDPLTGIANRRQFDESLRHEWERAGRANQGIALLMIDIDHFKLLNDGLGHPAGDQGLRAVAKALAESATRKSDVVARYGGEEFAVILPAATLEQAMMFAEIARSAIERLDLPTPAPGGRVTASIGVGHAGPGDDADMAALIARADAALYRAKRQGRNRSAC